MTVFAVHQYYWDNGKKPTWRIEEDIVKTMPENVHCVELPRCDYYCDFFKTHVEAVAYARGVSNA